MKLVLETKAPLEGIKKSMEGVKSIVEGQAKKNKVDYEFEYDITQEGNKTIVDMPNLKVKSRLLVWQFKTALKMMLKQNGHSAKISVEK